MIAVEVKHHNSVAVESFILHFAGISGQYVSVGNGDSGKERHGQVGIRHIVVALDLPYRMAFGVVYHDEVLRAACLDYRISVGRHGDRGAVAVSHGVARGEFTDFTGCRVIAAY